MSDPLYAFPTVCAQTLRALARYPSRTAFSWPGGSITYRRRHRPDRPHPERVHAARPCARRPRRVPHRQPRRHLVRRRRRAIVAAVDHLAASAGVARRPAVPDRGFRSADAGGRRRHVPRSRRRPRRAGIRPEERVHARPGRLRRRSAGRGRGGGHRQPAQFRRAGRHRDAELHRRHHRQVERRAALPPRIWRLRQCHPGRLRDPGYPELSHGGADQPRRRHQGAADADARRHRAHAEGLRSRGGVQDHRSASASTLPCWCRR